MWQTDGRTDGLAIAYSSLSICCRAKMEICSIISGFRHSIIFPNSKCVTFHLINCVILDVLSMDITICKVRTTWPTTGDIVIHITSILWHRDTDEDDDAVYWIGLWKTTATTAPDSVWLDGNPSTYRRWNGVSRANQCINMWEGEFSDYFPCTQSLKYICKAGKCWPILFLLVI